MEDDIIMDKKIYALKLHESIRCDGFEIIRVASGWIYSREYDVGFNVHGNINKSRETIFVPFDNRFQ